MENIKRTPKESSQVVAKTIAEIRRKSEKNKLTDELISETCEKYEINEKHIRTVAGWNK